MLIAWYNITKRSDKSTHSVKVNHKFDYNIINSYQQGVNSSYKVCQHVQ